MSRGFACVFIVALCGGIDPLRLPIPLRAFRLHEFMPGENKRNIPLNTRAQRHPPAWQQRALARTKHRR